MIKKTTAFLTLSALILSGFSCAVFAQSKMKNNSNDYDSHLAKQKVVKHLKRTTGGKVDVFAIKQLSSNSGKVWRVKFMKDGKVQYMDVIPQSLND